MPDEDNLPPLVHTPKTLTEALALLNAYPKAQLWAGGTASPEQDFGSPIRLPTTVVSLHLVDELKRVQYGDRFVDLGAGMPLNQVLHVVKAFLNPALRQAILATGYTALRNLATLGGNLCQKGFFGDLFPVLHLIGAQFEFRGVRSSRWLTSTQVSDQGRLTPLAGEILTRVRIPQEEWPHFFYQKIGNFRTPWDERLSMTALARTKHGLVEALRLIFYLPHTGLLRHRGLEAEFVGQRVPFAPRLRQEALKSIQEAMQGLSLPPSLFQKDRVLHMTRWVLSQIQDD